MNKDFLNQYPSGSRYETFLLYNSSILSNIKILALDYHVERLFINNEGLSTRFITQDSFYSYVVDRLSNVKACDSIFLVRIISYGSEIDILVSAYETRSFLNAKCTYFETERIDPSLKTLPAKESFDAREFAKSNNYDEALLVDTHGYVREGAWTSIFWVSSGGSIRSTQNNVLPGITIRLLREYCIERSLTFEYFDVTKEQLVEDAVELFICNSVIGIVPVVVLDKHYFKHSSRTISLLEEFNTFINKKYVMYRL